MSINNANGEPNTFGPGEDNYGRNPKFMTPNFIEKPQDEVTVSVMEDLKRRADLGVKKYGTTLEQNDHQNMLQHAYEESLDLAQYLKKEIRTLNTVQNLIHQYPNDAELGKAIRAKYDNPPF